MDCRENAEWLALLVNPARQLILARSQNGAGRKTNITSMLSFMLRCSLPRLLQFRFGCKVVQRAPHI